jgi:hypothetical protein
MNTLDRKGLRAGRRATAVGLSFVNMRERETVQVLVIAALTGLLLFVCYRWSEAELRAYYNMRSMGAIQTDTGRVAFELSKEATGNKSIDENDVKRQLAHFVTRCNSYFRPTVQTDWAYCTFYLSKPLISRWTGESESPYKELVYPAQLQADRKNKTDSFPFNATSLATDDDPRTPWVVITNPVAVRIGDAASSLMGYERTFTYTVYFKAQVISRNGGVDYTKNLQQTISIRLMTGQEYNKKMSLNEHYYTGGGTDFFTEMAVPLEIIKYETNPVGN